MSLLRRLRRRHRSGRLKAHSPAGVDKLVDSNDYSSSQRDRQMTQRAPAERTGSSRSVSRAGGSDRLPSVGVQSEEGACNGQRTSSAFEGQSNWLFKARVVSFLLVSTSAFFAGNSAILGLTMVVALFCDVVLCKLHRRSLETSSLAEEDCARRESPKSVRSDGVCASDEFIFPGNSGKLAPLPGVSAMDSQAPMDNVIVKKSRKLHGQNFGDSSQSASSSARASTQYLPFEACAGSPGHSSSGKLRMRLKSKNLLNHLRKKESFSAPSSPVGSSHDRSPFSDPLLDCETSLNRPVVRGRLSCSADRPPLDLFSDQEIPHSSTRTNERQLARPLRKSHEEKRRKISAKRRSIYIAVELLIIIGGLFGGRVVATIGLVSWWLLLSKVSRQPAVCEMHTQQSQHKQGQETQ